MSDPTGTVGLRRSFLAEANRRLGQLRSQTYAMLVERDLMASRGDPLAAILPHPGNRLPAFTEWFSKTAEERLLGGNWWERFLERAYQSGVVAGRQLVFAEPVPVPRAPLPPVYAALAHREFSGIGSALVQHVTRQAASAALSRRTPLPMYQGVLQAVRRVGQPRLKAAVNSLSVQVHNAARLKQFQAAGVTRVGLTTERLERPRIRPRRLQLHDHRWHDAPARKGRGVLSNLLRGLGGIAGGGGLVNVLTAGDDLVCQECEDIADEGPYELDEAQGLIPAHPHCRCAFVPALDLRFATNRELGEEG